MEKNYTIAGGGITTIGELRKLIADIPGDYFVSICGERDFYINVCPKSGDVVIDTVKIDFDENEEKLEFEIKDGDKLIGTVWYNEDVEWCYFCEDDRHEEHGFTTAQKAEDALLEYFYNA